MTTKRFMVDDCGELIDLNNHKFINYGEECCNLLNEQHETIQRLKQNIDELMQLDVEEELLKENEQLKQQVGDLKFELRTIQAYDRTEKEEHSDSVHDFQKKLEKW